MLINNLEIDTKTLTKEDMPNEQFEDIYLFCGADVAVKLLKEFGGSTIKVPVRGFKKIEEKIIKEEYNGTAISIQRLARKFKTTEKNIRDILYAKKITPPVQGQVSLDLDFNQKV